MSAFTFRYNRFSKSYLINLNNFEFEVEPDLFNILKTYYNSIDSLNTIENLRYQGITINTYELDSIIQMIENRTIDYKPKLQRRTFKILDFKIFNDILNHTYIIWFMFFLVVMFGLSNLYLLEKFFLIPKAENYSFTKILLIVPIYYFSRFLFTPVHEFGHYFFYYLFTKKSASFYIQIPGFMYFGALTTTDDLFYIQNPFKRILISIAGILFELILLIFILALFQNSISFFYLQLLTLRIFLSVLFNLNFLSQSTDGHLLLTDLLGFTTFTESYSDFLRSLINKSYIPIVPINKRMRNLFHFYTISGVLLIIGLVYTQIIFFKHIIDLLLLPLTKFSFYFQLGPIEIFFLMLTFLYYVDLGFRFYEKRLIFSNILKIKRNEELN